eukprot:m51a1_g7960 hypothetical protein (322) ;mRNA; r:223420-226242
MAPHALRPHALVLLLAGLSVAEWVAPAAWPDAGSVPTWFERGATFWLSLLRESYGAARSCQHSFAALSGYADAAAPCGSPASLPAVPMGLNTLRAARAHALDRFRNCLGAAGTGMAASDMASQTSSCDGTANTVRWGSHLAESTATAGVRELSFARYFTPPYFSLLEGPALAVSELSCAGTASSDGAHLNAYSLSCVLTAECESCSSASPSALRWSGHLLATAGHTAAYYDSPLFFAIGLSTGIASVTVVVDGARSNLTRIGTGTHWYSWASHTQKRAGACHMYHFEVSDGASTYRYPTEGQFGTIHMGSCSIDFQPCWKG